MMPRSVVFGGLLFASLALLAAGAPVSEKGKSYNSPEAVFKAAQGFAKKKDFKGFLGCMTEDSQKLVTGQLIMTGSMIKAFAGLDPSGKAAEMVKPIDKVFSKHGLTDEALKKIKSAKDPKQAGKTMRAAAELVKSRADFCSDLIAALDKANPKGAQPFAEGTLKDVKIDGDKAKATIVMKAGEKERTEPIEFAKVGGGWKLVMPEPKVPATPKLPPTKKD
jgi:hypothetical protein